MEFCRPCSEFFSLSLACVTGEHTDSLYGRRLCALDERKAIRESSRGCYLCRRLLEFLESRYEQQNDEEDIDDDEFFDLLSCLYRSDLVDDGEGYSRLELNWYGHRKKLRFAVWADQGHESPLTFHGKNQKHIGTDLLNLVTWAPVFYNSPVETTNLIRRWLGNCLEHHGICEISGMELPSRVLAIQDDAGVLSVRLRETHGLKGVYCALSHCWGPEDKRPLKTTRENFGNHLSCIPWDHLPNTFRDAIKVIRSLGFEYLWIDSLCIVQDDKQDWFNESQRMASVYQGAALVIAAADSEDSHQGLTKARRPEALEFRCPVITEGGTIEGVCHVAELEHEKGPQGSPLHGRAWAFQEWYLSRRIVFFTSTGISWRCKTMDLDERGTKRDWGSEVFESWERCLEEYSAKSMTFPSDRIVALLGIVAKLQKSREGSYVVEPGVWEDELEQQLLWRSLDVKGTDFPSVPSWSWATTGGAKAWLWHPTRLSPAVVNHTTQSVRLRKSRSLSASGLLIKATMPESQICERCRGNMEFADRASARAEEQLIPWFRLGGQADNVKNYAMYEAGGARPPNVIVLAAIDYQWFPELFCFIIASADRHPYFDPCYAASEYEYDSDDETEDLEGDGEEVGEDNEMSLGSKDGSEEDAVEDGEDDESNKGSTDAVMGQGEDGYSSIDGAKVDEPVHECVDLREAGRSREYHWALLLVPVDEALTKFRRVGLALLYPRALETAESEVKEFEIV